MYNGVVTYRALITSNGLKFPSFEFNPNEPGVDKVVIESPSGDEILSAVHLRAVPTVEVGRALAHKVITAALDRISFRHSATIENSQMTNQRFAPVNPTPGSYVQINVGDLVILGGQANMILGIQSADLKVELEQIRPPGEQLYGAYRLALQSKSPVEKFMHLYQLLLRLFGDDQAKVDNFIRTKEPTVPQTPDPRPGHTNLETVYTRLRNEFAHRRVGVNMQTTKAEIVQWLGGLVGLVKTAIREQP